ncbi:MAG: carboxynorspermidine decarboxylase [Lentisphaeria bacterium]|jgi:carboxynorspermidine decarboxylase
MTVHSKSFLTFNPLRVPSPCFVVDEVAVEKNLKKLADVQARSGAKILMALKAFSMFSLAPLIGRYLSGVCASGLHEALLGKEEYCTADNKGEVHTFCAAYTEADLHEILEISDHVVFNSFGQWRRFQAMAMAAKQQRPQLQFGLRLNPQHSEGTAVIYDPCAPCSRLGIPADQFHELDLSGISGIHFHTLCEQNYEPLARTLDVVERQLGNTLSSLKWINFGGGHHITADDYNVEALIERIIKIRKTYDIDVYLEPGEAIAINTGILVSEVLDITHNGMDLAILDISATCHIPDTLEMPYRAHIFDSGEVEQKQYSYRLGGQTCLAGDVINDYSFDGPLHIGQRLIFDDMSHYTMVKTTTFNGIALPSIATWNSNSDRVELIKIFGYEDFKSRLS